MNYIKTFLVMNLFLVISIISFFIRQTDASINSSIIVLIIYASINLILVLVDIILNKRYHKQYRWNVYHMAMAMVGVIVFFFYPVFFSFETFHIYF